jgi:thiamine biosynthesis protein ThiI
MAAKRGVSIEAVHFQSPPYTSEAGKQKVLDLAKLVSAYAGRMRVHVVPFTEIQMDIYKNCPHEELVIIMRRFMMRIAEKIARNIGAAALVTGESIGQVASQTLESMNATGSVVSLPVLRPLVGMDKLEIMERAEAIGTYETSILPYEDCCTVFVPKHPVTHPKLERIERSERRLPVDELVEKAIAGVEVIEI